MPSYEITAVAIMETPPNTPRHLAEQYVGKHLREENLEEFWEAVNLVGGKSKFNPITKSHQLIFEVSTTVVADDEEEAINQIPEYNYFEIDEIQAIDLGY